MDYAMINELLNKYWLCETSLEEERELRRFFASEEVPEHLLAYKAWFCGRDEAAIPVLGADFDKRILKKIKPKERLSFHLGRRYVTGIAASLAILVAASLYVYNQTDWADPSYQDTYQTPEEALRAAQVSLSIVSSEINRGQKMVYNEMKKTAPITDLINNIDKLEGE